MKLIIDKNSQCAKDVSSKILHELRTHQIELELQNEELRSAQQTLADSRQQYADLYDFAPVGYATISDKGFITKANLTLSGMLGFDRARLLTLPFSAVISERDQDRYYRHRRLLLSTHKRQDFELQLKKADGRPFEAALETVIAADVDGDSGQFRVAVIDISRRKAAETEKTALEAQLRQSQKMQALGTLAGGIAHEFNNLLAIIFGSVEVARFEVAEGSFVESQLAQIVQASNRAKKLVKQILLFSRKSECSTKAINLRSVVENERSFLATTLPNSVEVTWQLCQEECRVVADANEIRQILMNLCSNGVYAMNERGTLSIKLQRHRLDKPDNSVLKSGLYAVLSVTDTGNGMNTDVKERAFEPFFTTKPLGQGTGMGLSLVYSIMERCGGVADIQTTPGQGATVRLYFPITDLPIPIAPVENVPLNITGHERILLVEDDEMLAVTTRLMLEKLGYKVTLKTDSPAARDAFARDCNAFDLVITDQVMPYLSGVDLASTMLALRPDIPIVLCTGYSSEVDDVTAKHIGISAFALKPLSVVETGKLIRSVLDK